MFAHFYSYLYIYNASKQFVYSYNVEMIMFMNVFDKWLKAPRFNITESDVSNIQIINVNILT